MPGNILAKYVLLSAECCLFDSGISSYSNKLSVLNDAKGEMWFFFYENFNFVV